jgi:hypothetical protein
MTPLASTERHGLFQDLAWWGWAVAAVSIAAGLWVLWLAVRWTLRPGETDPGHVKRTILDDEDRAMDAGGPPPAPPT